MKPRSVHRPGRRHWPWRGMVVLWIATTLITIGVPGSVAAATCTGVTFAGNTFTVQENFDGRGNGTASVSGCEGPHECIGDADLHLNTPPFGDDLDILLVHPNGVNNLVILVGFDQGAADNLHGTFTIADSAGTCLPNETATSVPEAATGPRPTSRRNHAGFTITCPARIRHADFVRVVGAPGRVAAHPSHPPLRG